MTLDQLKNEWKTDTKIDQHDLSRESLNGAKLHSKYLDLLIECKREAKRHTHDLARMYQFKQRYWSGLFTKEELKEFNLPQYQFAKPLKAEMDSKLAADEDCISIQESIDECELKIFFLESVMKSVHSRSFDIKNSIDFARFQAGN